MSNLRKDIIKLAHQRPELRRHLIPLLRQAKEQTFEEAIEGRKFKNPETGNQVTYKSLPKPEQIKLHKEWEAKKEKDKDKEHKDEGEHEEKDLGKSLKKDFSKFLGDLKNAKESIVKALKAAPDTVKAVMVDADKRKEFTDKAAETLKKSPGKLAKHILENAKKEIHEVKHATHAAKKLFKKPPGPFSAEDKKAFISTGAYVAGAVMASLPPIGTAIGAAGSVGASFAKHVAIKAVHGMLDQGFVGYEWAHEVFHAVHHITEHVAAEKDEGDENAAMEELMEGMVRLIAEEFKKGLSEEDMKKIMEGSDDEEA